MAEESTTHATALAVCMISSQPLLSSNSTEYILKCIIVDHLIVITIVWHVIIIIILASDIRDSARKLPTVSTIGLKLPTVRKMNVKATDKLYN